MDSMDALCINSTSPLYSISVPSQATWSMIHLINAGAAQQLAFSIDEHDLWVISADGVYIVPQKVQASPMTHASSAVHPSTPSLLKMALSHLFFLVADLQFRRSR